MSAGLRAELNREVQGPMAQFPASVAAYGKPGGGDVAAGDRLVLSRSRQDAARDRRTTAPTCSTKGGSPTASPRT